MAALFDGVTGEIGPAGAIEVSSRLQLTARVQEILKYYKSNTKDIRARLMSRTSQTGAKRYVFFASRISTGSDFYAMARSSEDLIRQQILALLEGLQK